MYDRCISIWMSTGSTRSPPSGGGVVTSTTRSRSSQVVGAGDSDVQEADVLGVADDETPPRLDVLAHQDAEQLVRRCRVVEGDLQQHPGGRVHGGFPQLLRVHLAKTLVALDAALLGQLLARLHAGLDEPVPLAVGVRVLRRLALPLDLVERRLAQVHVAVLDERA